MDEPLSNLDAALRVQTRAEILKLQDRLGTTTIYVTHDQIEAMTMGDRIAVMNLGVLQQIGPPKDLYMSPANTFVATFIGSPAMNLLPSGALGVGIGGSGQLVGFRPEHVQLGNGKPNCAHYDATIEVVQYLGDEQLAYLRLGDAEIVAKLPLEAQARARPQREVRRAVSQPPALRRGEWRSGGHCGLIRSSEASQWTLDGGFRRPTPRIRTSRFCTPEGEGLDRRALAGASLRLPPHGSAVNSCAFRARSHGSSSQRIMSGSMPRASARSHVSR